MPHRIFSFSSTNFVYTICNPRTFCIFQSAVYPHYPLFSLHPFLHLLLYSTLRILIHRFTHFERPLPKMFTARRCKEDHTTHDTQTIPHMIYRPYHTWYTEHTIQGIQTIPHRIYITYYTWYTDHTTQDIQTIPHMIYRPYYTRYTDHTTHDIQNILHMIYRPYHTWYTDHTTRYTDHTTHDIQNKQYRTLTQPLTQKSTTNISRG
jgi:hypothetical protein